ncbi:hypothetical protein HanIR_Chr13g0649421 [Helianthus annuus]|nr:hypothetical protein HanIR_Chr13g0649421 [Helianthus annuus]
MTLSNSLHNSSFVDPKIISSTYICTIKRCPATSLVNRVLSTVPLVNPLVSRCWESVSYQALGAWCNPYNALSSRYTLSLCTGSVKPGG